MIRLNFSFADTKKKVAFCQDMERNKGNILVKRSVIIVDFAILNLVLLAYMILTPEISPAAFDLSTKITIFAANVAMFLAESFYSTIIHIRRVSFIQVCKRTFCLSGLASIIFFLTIRILINYGGLFYFSLLFFASFYIILIISRAIELRLLKYVRTRGYNSRTAIFIGNDPAVLDMYKTLVEDPSAGYRVNGYFADDDIKGAPKEFTHLGTLSELNEIISYSIDNTIHGAPTNIHEMFCCLSHNQSKEVIKLMQFCDKNVIHFYYLPRQFEGYQLHLDTLQFMGKNIYTNHIEPLSNPTNRAIKRLFDVLVSSIVCLFLLFIIPIVALIIKLQSPGPIFFCQDRTGINGKTFRCVKFRSMHINKDADKAQATENDPRKFSFGNFMRKTNIDELPQFLNVLRGDMSIVGPRPHMLYHTETYGTIINKYMVRHFAKPGITGWAQVTGYRGETKELWQMEERVRRDIWYLENWSFWLDIRIIFLTAKSIIFPDKNAY